jgi:uncharacterized protein
MIELLNNVWSVYLDTAFWLLTGLLAAGLVKTYIPEDAMQRWLGGRGLSAVLRASLFGAPLPLCSCGVLPAAIGLRRSGASKEATVSFLISTPETSIDSVAVTYALMGPVMAIYRPFAALISAIITGMLVVWVDKEDDPSAYKLSQKKPVYESSCCGVKESSCCGSEPQVPVGRWQQAMRYAGAELLDDISRWLFIGIVGAGIILTLVPPGWLAQWGSGILPMLMMLVIGIPMYICASASTPIAASLILAGVSPGTVLVFLLVGPATNIAGLILVKRELGTKVTVVYILGIAIVSLLAGLLLDWMLGSMGIVINAELGADYNMLPAAISWGSALLLLLLSVPLIRRRIFPFLN